MRHDKSVADNFDELPLLPLSGDIAEVSGVAEERFAYHNLHPHQFSTGRSFDGSHLHDSLDSRSRETQLMPLHDEDDSPIPHDEASPQTPHHQVK